uniref:Coactivator associated arginine methyltransferase 1 n=1 Tax=Junco hyemalis TaxID=40217 RepID=A0A8C5JQZ4_JUNHY
VTPNPPRTTQSHPGTPRIHTRTSCPGGIVLDVGCGSGILSFFAAQAGARKIYAVEASTMAQHAEVLVKSNNLTERIVVIPGKVEEVSLPEQVDIIISEPMGYMLFNERMLESYLHAKKYLKPSGNMFPTIGDVHLAPFTDEQYQPSFHGVDLSALRGAAVDEYFRQPVVVSDPGGLWGGSCPFWGSLGPPGRSQTPLPTPLPRTPSTSGS